MEHEKLLHDHYILSQFIEINMSTYHCTIVFSRPTICMVHYPLLLANWLSLSNTTVFQWSTGYPYYTLSPPTGPLAIPMVHYYLLLVQWISLWYTTLSFWPTGYPYCTLVSSTGPMDITKLHYPLLLAHWISLWYTSIFY